MERVRHLTGNTAVPNNALPPGLRGRLFRYVPALDALRHYSWPALGGDVMAGLTVATVAVPQAMAYSTLAGLPPQYGLYTAIVMTAVGALLASSRQLINGPTNALSIALLSALSVVPAGERISAAVLMAFLVGSIQLGISLLRLGDLSRFISHGVIVGFTVGAGTLLVLDQMKNFLGLDARGDPDDHFLKRFWLSLTDGGGVHWPTCLIGIATVAVVLAVRQLNGYLRRRGARFPIPQHLVAVALMAALVWAFRLDETEGVKIVGPIPAALPGFQLPEVRLDHVRLLAGSAFALAVLGLLEALAMSKAIASDTGQKLDVNQQCLSEGAANLAGSFFQCVPGSGSLTRSTVNRQAGAVSQWSGVFSAVAVAAMVLLFAPLARYIPRAALAGLLMLAAFRMVDRKQFIFHLRATRFDAIVVLATALAAVFISVEFCIVIGVFLSFVLYVPRAAQVRLVPLTQTPEQRLRRRVAGDPPCDRLLCYDLEGELFFGAEPDLEKHLAAIEDEARGKVRVVVLVLERARNPDAAFLNLLRSFHAHLRRRHVMLLLGGVRPDLKAALASTGLDAQIDHRHIFYDTPGHTPGTRDALRSAYALLGDDLCATCPRRQEGAAAEGPFDYVI
jgi:SulP family sulfate permease